MGKPKTIIDDIKEQVKQNKKEEKTMKNSTRKETVKTIIITILATVLLSAPAFVFAGVKYEESNIERITDTAKSLTVQSLKTEATLK